MSQTIAPTQIQQAPPGQTRQRRQNPLRAESNVKVTEQFAELIRASALKDEYKTFNHTRDIITVLDAHNSYTNYVKHILPTTVPDYIIEGTGSFVDSQVTEKYKCGPILTKLWQCDYFFPKDLKAKWRIIVRNLTQIDGTNYIRNRRNPTALPRTQATSDSTSGQQTETPREYQPAAINHLRNERREDTMRRSLGTFFTQFDKNIKRLFDEKKFDFPAENPDESAPLAKRWKFEDPVNKPEEETPPAKKQKIEKAATSKEEELSIDDACVICMEKPRTHAFLHYGLSGQDVSSHFVACQECAHSCRWADQGCPCCRAPVINVIRVLK